MKQKPSSYINLLYHLSSLKTSFTCAALRELEPFVQFKKREKYPWRSANFSKVAGTGTN